MQVQYNRITFFYSAFFIHPYRFKQGHQLICNFWIELERVLKNLIIFLGLKYADGVVPGQGSPDHAEEKEEEEDEVSPPPSTAEQK